MTATSAVSHTRVSLQIGVGAPLPDDTELSIAVDIVAPAVLSRSPVVLFCQPGGALDKGYFQLLLDDGDDSFSFAAQMARRGFITVAMDHLGIGASSRPRDGFALTPEVLSAANARAVAALCEGLRAGSLSPQLPSLPAFTAVGVGHSMGAMLSSIQQAHHHSYAALVLLGFGTNGLAEFLSPEAKAFAGDAAGARANISRLARAAGDDPYPGLRITSGNAAAIYGGGADRRAVAALKTAATNLLAVPGLFSMIPGGTAPECAQIDVPLFIANGDRDICGDNHQVPAAFRACNDLTLVVLRETGHSHFLFPSTAFLCRRIAGWIEKVVLAQPDD